MWSALAEMFGNSLTSNFGETCPPLWCRKIDELDDAEIKRGLNRLASSNQQFAPNLGQFVTACKQADDQRPHVDPEPARRLIRDTPARSDLGLPAGMSPICYQRAQDIADGRWPQFGGAYQRPGSLPAKLWRQYLAGDFPNVEKHREYCARHPDEEARWHADQNARGNAA